MFFTKYINPLCPSFIYNVELCNKTEIGMFFICGELWDRHNKRYSTIDQQIARHFVHYNECLYHPLPFYTTQTMNPFLTSSLSANHDKGLGF